MNAQSKIETSLVAALAKALSEIEGVQKNKANPGLKGARYADLSAVIEAIEPVKLHGLWFRQVPKRDLDGALIETFYIHESGEELSAGETYVPANKKDPQGFGSALTYCRRYALMTAFGLAAEDDDGHAATQAMRNGNGRSDNRQLDSRDNNSRSGSQDASSEMPDAEWAKLSNLMKATNTAASGMLKHYDVKNLRQLSQDQYFDAIELLEKRLAKLAKEESNHAGSRSDAGHPPASEFGDINPDDIPY